MKIYSTNNGIVLCTNIDELNSRGICESRMDSRQTSDMIREGFSHLGISAEGIIEAETYINGRAVLIFARLCSADDTAIFLFSFDCFENLISACHTLTSYPPATLLWKDEKYYIALHSDSPKKAAYLLREYGNAERNPALVYANLLEHGKVIGKGDILRSIASFFPLQSYNNLLFADSLNPNG